MNSVLTEIEFIVVALSMPLREWAVERVDPLSRIVPRNFQGKPPWIEGLAVCLAQQTRHGRHL
jgi:hypothetical protein